MQSHVPCIVRSWTMYVSRSKHGTVAHVGDGHQLINSELYLEYQKDSHYGMDDYNPCTF